MTCNSCVASIKDKLLRIGEIESADIQLAAPQATIKMREHIATETLQNAIGNGKYTITEENSNAMGIPADATSESNSYYPIFLIFGYIAGITLLIQFSKGGFVLMSWMSSFMAGFFLLFSFFKLLNLKGFVEGYATYDIIAKQLPAYGFVYPFLELSLGIAYLTGFNPLATNIATLIIMGISSIGVIQSLLKKTTFQCACLGTIIKLPLSKVTLVEDLLMVAMSAGMLLGGNL